MTLSLTGFLSFRAAGACFLIPSFSYPGSNGAFAHELDGKGKILSFYSIEPAGYNFQPHHGKALQRDIGDGGIFAVRLSNDEIILGEFSEIREELVALDLEKFGAPFFNVDVFAFIGDLERRRVAINRASNLFSDNRIAAAWRAREKIVKRVGLNRKKIRKFKNSDDAKVEPLVWYYKNTESSDWADRWRQLWKQGDNFDELAKLAFWWFDANNFKNDAGNVLADLLQHPTSFERAVRVIVEWLARLKSAKNSHVFPVEWGEELPRQVMEPPVLQEIEHMVGLYLTQTPSVRAVRWISLWVNISKISSGHWLWEIARDYLPVFGDDFRFQKRLILPLAEKFGNIASYREAIFTWMHSAQITNPWINVYSVLRHFVPALLSRKALDYLIDGGTALSGWKILWDALRENSSTPEEFDKIAIEWLSKASMNMRAWPEIFIEVAARHSRNEMLRRLALTYLSEAFRHPLRDAIATFVDIDAIKILPSLPSESRSENPNVVSLIHGCLAVIVGVGEYSDWLRRELPRHFSQIRFYYWKGPKPHEGDSFLDPFNLNAIASIFRRDRVSHVLHAGSKILALSRGALIDAEAEMYDFLDLPHQFSKDFADLLRANDIKLLSVRQIFDDFAALPGKMGDVGLSQNISARMQQLEALALDYCSRERHHSATAAIFDVGPGDGAPRQAQVATAYNMLGSLGPKDEGVTRVLVKVKPESAAYTMDDPTIDPQIIRIAHESQIDVIAIDARQGIVVNRAETVRLANIAGIAVVGI